MASEYWVRGADRLTGENIERLIVAESDQHAREVASANSILTESVVFVRHLARTPAAAVVLEIIAVLLYFLGGVSLIVMVLALADNKTGQTPAATSINYALVALAIAALFHGLATIIRLLARIAARP